MNIIKYAIILTFFCTKLYAQQSDYKINKIDSQINIDGLLIEDVWQQSSSERVKKVVRGTTNNNNRVTFSLVWDEIYLYAGIKVLDAKLYNDSQPSRYWEDDGIEMYIDANGNRGQVIDSFDRQYVKNLVSGDFNSRGNSTGVKHAITSIEGGYLVELSIPWSNLKITPAEGLKMGLDIGYNDDDDGGNRDHQLMWKGEEDNWKSTDDYGIVELFSTINDCQSSNTSCSTKYYITKQGSGKKDGSSWSNSYSEAEIQEVLNSMAPGSTLFLGSGTYSSNELIINTSGTAQKSLNFIGVNRGQGYPILKGNKWSENDPNNGRSSGLSLKRGASFWNIKNLNLERYWRGVQFDKEGINTNITVDNVDVRFAQDGYWIDNVDQSIFRNIEVKNYTKKGMRFRANCKNLRIDNCLADASSGSDSWFNKTEPIPMGFLIEKEGSEFITFSNCTAINNKRNNQNGYLNGDGFVTEKTARDITFSNCIAYNNQDGGFDCKGDRFTFEGCISFNNYRNFRWWNGFASYTNCITGYAEDAGMWFKGDATIHKSTFVGNKEVYEKEQGNVSFLSNSIFYQSGSNVPSCQNCKYDDPKFKKPNPNWDGTPKDAYNSQRYGSGFGYSSVSHNRSEDKVYLNFEAEGLLTGVGKSDLIYPNPLASGNLFIKIKDFGTTVTIHTATGVLLKEIPSNQGVISIPKTVFEEKGLYLIKLTSESISKSYKLIVK